MPITTIEPERTCRWPKIHQFIGLFSDEATLLPAPTLQVSIMNMLGWGKWEGQACLSKFSTNSARKFME